MSMFSLQEQESDVGSLKQTLKTFYCIDEIKEVLQGRLCDFAFHSLKNLPHPKELLHNMEASLLVVQSILRNEKIVIVGDYDADGVCATCIMLDFFENLGYANISFAMPNRFIHGYGFSKKLFHEILENDSDVKLIITVDNGVSSFEAGEMCKDKGIKFIITDHHTLEVTEDDVVRIPACDFLVNPQQEACTFPYKDICGSLVAWYFCCAIKINMQEQYQNKQNDFGQTTKNNFSTYIHNLQKMRMESLLLLVGIAIISDVMPLNAINHTICKYAMKYFPYSNKFAFQVFMEYLRCNLDSQTLGFRLIPLLNAAGRISDGKIALQFLRSHTFLEAKQHFKQLKDLNAKRKELQEDVTTKAFQSVETFVQNKDMICVVGDDWHEGVLGIVAGKMADEFQKPCFVLTNINGVCKGSGRSYGDVDLIASMQKIGHLMKRYGGHVGAVGLEIAFANLEAFMQEFEPITYKIEKRENVLGILHSDLIGLELLKCLDDFEPYGNGNPSPKFFMELSVYECKKTSKGFVEFRLKTKQNKIFKAMLFNLQYTDCIFCVDDVLQMRVALALDFQSKSNSAKTQNGIMLIIDKIYGLQRKSL